MEKELSELIKRIGVLIEKTTQHKLKKSLMMSEIYLNEALDYLHHELPTV